MFWCSQCQENYRITHCCVDVKGFASDLSEAINDDALWNVPVTLDFGRPLATIPMNCQTICQGKTLFSNQCNRPIRQSVYIIIFSQDTSSENLTQTKLCNKIMSYDSTRNIKFVFIQKMVTFIYIFFKTVALNRVA